MTSVSSPVCLFLPRPVVIVARARRRTSAPSMYRRAHGPFETIGAGPISAAPMNWKQVVRDWLYGAGMIGFDESSG
jgi:hypothetical protein